MSILVDSNTKAICQGITGHQGTLHTEQAIAYGTKMMAGVTPGKGGTRHLGIPVFNTVEEATRELEINTSVIYVQPAFAADAIMEAIDAKIQLVVCITEGIPILDMWRVKRALVDSNTTLIGPNTIGVITPGVCKLGIMQAHLHGKGKVGIVSRSGTLFLEASYQTTKLGLGQSTAVGIGGDPIIGLGFVNIVDMFMKDDQTEIIVVIGEMGGRGEINVVEYIKKHGMKKPIVGFIAGRTAQKGQRMGHAGAMSTSGSDTAETKIIAMQEAGIIMVESLNLIGDVVQKTLQKSR